jgi:hypothetical protein
MQFVYATDLPNEVLDAFNRRIRNETDNFTTAALQDAPSSTPRYLFGDSLYSGSLPRVL